MKRRVLRPLALLTAAVVAVTGCSTVDSADIRTSGMTADLLVTVPEGRTAASVTGSFRVGTMTFVELGPDEKVTASSGGQSVTLKRAKLAGSTSYTGNLDAVRAGDDVTFDLRRDGDNTSAPRSTVTLPEPVRFTAPAAGTRFSRRADLVVRFAPGPRQTLEWEGACVRSGRLELEPGRSSAVISRGTIQPSAGTPEGGSSPQGGTGVCEVTLMLTRRVEGKLDPAFKDGVVAAEARATRQMVSAP